MGYINRQGSTALNNFFERSFWNCLWLLGYVRDGSVDDCTNDDGDYDYDYYYNYNTGIFSADHVEAITFHVI